MSARDDLLARAKPWTHPCGPHELGVQVNCTCQDGDPRHLIVELVAFIEASTPRTVTSPAELYDLPDRSTILHPDSGQAWQLEKGWWRSTDGLRYSTEAAAPPPGGTPRVIAWTRPAESIR